jgi:hypothetical protein
MVEPLPPALERLLVFMHSVCTNTEAGCGCTGTAKLSLAEVSVLLRAEGVHIIYLSIRPGRGVCSDK